MVARFFFVPSDEEHERLLGQMRAYMDAVRPDIECIVNAFGLSVKFVDIEWPNTSRGHQCGCGLSGLHNQRGILKLRGRSLVFFKTTR